MEHWNGEKTYGLYQRRERRSVEPRGSSRGGQAETCNRQTEASPT